VSISPREAEMWRAWVHVTFGREAADEFSQLAEQVVERPRPMRPAPPEPSPVAAEVQVATAVATSALCEDGRTGWARLFAPAKPKTGGRRWL